ncbi:hypothetical protein BH18ACT9_BH18ACT9_22350 [soil metagenome]
MSKKKSTATRRAEQLTASRQAATLREEQERQTRRRRIYVVGGGLAALLILLLGVGFAVQSSRDPTGQVARPPSGVVGQYAVARGDAEAPVTITVYEDFMCTFCGDLEAASGELFEEYVDGGDVRVEYRVVSFLDRASDGSDYSTRAMNALGVVLDTAGVDPALRFHDLLFVEQPEEGTTGPSDEDLVRLAAKAGAQEVDVAAAIRDRKFEPWVLNATEAASEDEVDRTPTVLVEGETLEYETIDDLVRQIRTAVDSAAAS